MSEDKWIDCKIQEPPKDQKFLFCYYYGIGLGQWGQAYKTINGNSEKDGKSYILILHPSEILNSIDPFIWDEEYMKEMEVFWRYLPEPPSVFV